MTGTVIRHSSGARLVNYAPVIPSSKRSERTRDLLDTGNAFARVSLLHSVTSSGSSVASFRMTGAFSTTFAIRQLADGHCLSGNRNYNDRNGHRHACVASS